MGVAKHPPGPVSYTHLDVYKRQIVRRGVPLDVAVAAPVVLSTPLNRRAALRELDLVDARASVRRRIVLGVLLVAVIVLGLLVYLGRCLLYTSRCV